MVSSLLGLLLPMTFLATMRMLYVEEGWRSMMVAWLSCGDTSLVTWAESHDAGGETGLFLSADLHQLNNSRCEQLIKDSKEGDESLLRNEGVPIST